MTRKQRSSSRKAGKIRSSPATSSKVDAVTAQLASVAITDALEALSRWDDGASPLMLPEKRGARLEPHEVVRIAAENERLRQVMARLRDLLLEIATGLERSSE